MINGYGILVILGVVLIAGAVVSFGRITDLLAIILWVFGIGMIVVGAIGCVHLSNQLDAKIQEQKIQEISQSQQRYRTLIDQFQRKKHVTVQGVYNGVDEITQVWKAGRYEVVGTNGEEYDVFVDGRGAIQQAVSIGHN